jgi:glutathione synthase/RimK-type ligase-like ATP-grasp enzyme
MGRGHNDSEAIAKALVENFGFSVKQVGLSDLAKIDLAKVAAIDLKDCRGWQKRFDFFKEQLDILRERICQTGRAIPIINPPEMFEWVVSKQYLAEFRDKGVSIVETEFLKRAARWPDVFGLMNKNPDNRIVLKPARGSRAKDLIFITRRGEDAFEWSAPKPLDDSSATPHSSMYTGEALTAKLESYALKLWREEQPAILVQQFCRGIEISAVFIGSKAHYVARTTGPEGIAHDDFGGKILPQAQPDPSVVDFARQVQEALPRQLKHCAFLRVDMLKDGDNAPVLLEVEAGSARLFLMETARTEEYAEMIRDRVIAEGARTHC